MEGITRPSGKELAMDNGASSYRRFLDGDDEGMADIVREHKDGLILFLNNYVNNIYTAEEMTEETFFRLAVKKPKFRGKSSFRSWLYAIGRNVAVDYIRHSSKLTVVPAEGSEEYLSDMSDLESSYIKKESKIRMYRAMEKISAEYRQVLWLVYFEELPRSEVISVTGKNERQIRNLLYRAKQSLRSELEKEGFTCEEF